MKDMCETAKERYQKALTIFEASLRRGRPTKLSEVCRDNKVYYRGMLKWLYNGWEEAYGERPTLSESHDPDRVTLPLPC